MGASTREWLPALTGVRGLAVAFVLAFHAGLPIPSGGLAGVTLFFVLSGYLITTWLVREHEATGSVDLRHFFARRARRLLPALLVVIGIVTAVGVVAGKGPEAVQDAALSITYVANWARADGDPMGLLNHIWSLSIEAQFYLIWPVAFVLATRKGLLQGGAMVPIVIGLAVGSTVLRAVLAAAGADGGRIYFGTDVRADALLAGCALALIGAHRSLTVAIRPFAPLTLLAFVMVNLMPTLDPVWSDSAYAFATIASVGVVLVALQPNQQWTGLTISPLRWIGERSYSLYLVHVPVLMLVGAVLGTVDPVLRGIFAVCISVLLSIALYQFVETPFRDRGSAPVANVSRRLGLPTRIPAFAWAMRVRGAIPDSQRDGAVS